MQDERVETKDRLGWAVLNQLKSIHTLCSKGRYSTADWAIEHGLREKLVALVEDESWRELMVDEKGGGTVPPSRDAAMGMVFLMRWLIEYVYAMRGVVAVEGGASE